MPFLFGWVDRRDHRSIRNEAHRWSTRLIEIEDLFGCVFSTLESTKCHQLLYEISIARDASFSPTNYQWQILWCLAVRTNCYRNLARVISKHHIHSCCLSTLLYQGDRDKCRTPTPDETNARSDSIFLSTWTEDFSWTLPCFAPDKRESKKVFIKKLDSIRPNIDHKHTDSTLMTCWMKFFLVSTNYGRCPSALCPSICPTNDVKRTTYTNTKVQWIYTLHTHRDQINE